MHNPGKTKRPLVYTNGFKMFGMTGLTPLILSWGCCSSNPFMSYRSCVFFILFHLQKLLFLGAIKQKIHLPTQMDFNGRDDRIYRISKTIIANSKVHTTVCVLFISFHFAKYLLHVSVNKKSDTIS